MNATKNDLIGMVRAKFPEYFMEKQPISKVTKDILKEFIKQRFNDSIVMIGGKPIFDIDSEKLLQLKWFEDEIYAEVNTDFFHKKPVTYSKKMQAIKAEDIF